MPKIAYQRRQEKGEQKPGRLKIKKDDMVRVIAGRDKGKTGKVLDVDRYTRKVTMQPIAMPSRSLNAAIDFFAFVTTGF